MRKERQGDKHQLHVNTLLVSALGWPCPAPDQYSLFHFLLNAFLTLPSSVCVSMYEGASAATQESDQGGSTTPGWCRGWCQPQRMYMTMYICTRTLADPSSEQDDATGGVHALLYVLCVSVLTCIPDRVTGVLCIHMNACAASPLHGCWICCPHREKQSTFVLQEHITSAPFIPAKKGLLVHSHSSTCQLCKHQHNYQTFYVLQIFPKKRLCNKESSSESKCI